MTEPLTDPANDRMILHPIQYPDIWAEYKKQENVHWVATEVSSSLARDKAKLKLMSAKKVRVIKLLNANFAISDYLVNKNITTNLIPNITIPEARMCYEFQCMMENVHADAYSQIFREYVPDPDEREELMRWVEENHATKAKIEWQKKWIKADSPLSYKIVAFIIVEGVHFSGSFALVEYFAEDLPGQAATNELIRVDEAHHKRFGILIENKYIVNKVPDEDIIAMVMEGVEIEIEFQRELLKEPLLGMNIEQMTEYIHCVADTLLEDLHIKPIYNARNPFKFMERQFVGKSKVNQFETKNTMYNKASINSKGRVRTIGTNM